MFTAAVVEGIETGEADRDGDEWMSTDDLYQYVHDVVPRLSDQTPVRFVSGAGVVYLSHTPPS